MNDICRRNSGGGSRALEAKKNGLEVGTHVGNCKTRVDDFCMTESEMVCL